MIKRYSRPEMAAIWTDEHKYATWLRVEIAVCEAQADLALIPAAAVAAIKEKAGFSVERIEAIEAEVKHDVIAFLTAVGEKTGDEARYIHLGMTSSDLLDTALALNIQEAGEILLSDMERLREILRRQALQHKETICVGRSHGIHAEPTSFGLKFALWYDEMGRNLERMRTALADAAVGMVSGAVGTFAYIDPRIEAAACARLGLRPAPVTTQIIQRDIHAQVQTAIALCGAGLEKIAVEIRHLQRTEVLEAEEPFSAGQKGSSAMPHKRNPIGSENIAGLARLLRTNALAALENIALWHERDISHSSVERIIFPDSFILLDYMLHRLSRILEGLVVYPDQMATNLRRTRGLIFSQPVLLALTGKGMSRETAYKIVQENAMRCWRSGEEFKEILLADQRVLALLSPAEISACFDERIGLKHVDAIYRKAGIIQ
ncbi:MAG TPA: adenylosuccinate lyase [bacterium]|nr:adenylosuccinate lyase [bacterium]HQG45101.1 adenylosuccinate lyase [bacterium]HQI49774.1 adenylosuccinate lyase [bacterium]HQJ64956.1 adenylosuccinate lyase [bacterium]